MENLENLTPTQKKLLLILPAILVFVLGMMLFLLPLWEKQSKLSAQVDTQLNDIKRSQATAEQLPKLMQENEALKRKLSDLERRLPEEKEVSGLLKLVSEKAIQSGLTVVLWRPTGKSVHSSKDVYEIPMTMEMRGTYHKLGQFFSTINTLDRIVNVNNVTLKHSGKTLKKGAPLTISLTALTYSSIPPDEKKALEKAEKEKPKKP
jgi:type IV pilus assembly protein PilO